MKQNGPLVDDACRRVIDPRFVILFSLLLCVFEVIF